MSMGAVIAGADEVLTLLGIDPKDIGKALFARLGTGDKKRRLLAIEVTGLAAIQQAGEIMAAIEGKDDATAAAVRDQLIKSMSRTILLLVHTADLDGSSTGG